jgi:hypothetical protein
VTIDAEQWLTDNNWLCADGLSVLEYADTMDEAWANSPRGDLMMAGLEWALNNGLWEYEASALEAIVASIISSHSDCLGEGCIGRLGETIALSHARGGPIAWVNDWIALVASNHEATRSAVLSDIADSIRSSVSVNPFA